jgi:hypothetical protein
VKTTRESLHFDPALKTRRSIHLAVEFARKHASLRSALQEIASLPGCQWRIGSAGGASTPSHNIERKRDFVEFFLRARRMSVGRR